MLSQKNKSVVLIAQNDALVVLIEHRSILQGFGENRMYTRYSPIYIPKQFCGEPYSGQHSKHFRGSLHTRRVHCAFRFLFWWLFLHRRLRSRQRGLTSEDIKRHMHSQDDHFRRALPVFIRITRKIRRSLQQAFRLRLLASTDSGIPLLLSSNGASPHPFHLQVSVKEPVSNLTMYAIIRAKKRKSSRKYFNYRLVFQ